MKPTEENRNRISASEVAQFHFCPMSWYLRRQGFSPASVHLKSGKIKHKKIGRLLVRSNLLIRATRVLLLLGSFLVLCSLLFLILQMVIG